MVTHQLQVRCRPWKVGRTEPDVLPLSYTTNLLCDITPCITNLSYSITNISRKETHNDTVIHKLWSKGCHFRGHQTWIESTVVQSTKYKMIVTSAITDWSNEAVAARTSGHIGRWNWAFRSLYIRLYLPLAFPPVSEERRLYDVSPQSPSATSRKRYHPTNQSATYKLFVSDNWLVLTGCPRTLDIENSL